MKLRIWWIPQIPMKPFHADVASLSEARRLLTILAEYDLFQLKNRIKPDFSNAGGLEIFDEDEGEWFEWDDPLTGDSIDEITNERIRELERDHALTKADGAKEEANG